MISLQKLFTFIILLFSILVIWTCSGGISQNVQKTDSVPIIVPDYTQVTVPPNIAPLNFAIKEKGNYFIVSVSDSSGREVYRVRSGNGIIHFSERLWRKLLTTNKGNKISFQIYAVDKNITRVFEPFDMFVSNDSIDAYLVYRLIPPGYYSWSEIKIIQRSLENFEETSIVENQVIDKNCVNCHAFSQNEPEKFLIHVRGSKGGTYFANGKNLLRTNLKIVGMPGGATYPAWNPDGRFVAFSSNQVRQNFYAHPDKSIEVYDLLSTLILYDTQTNEILNITGQDSLNHLETFPTWSPDGNYLYFCTATPQDSVSNFDLNDIKKIHYNLARKRFNKNDRTFGETEIVFNALGIGKSVSFPRISPNGNDMIFTLSDYGTFPIWHQEADLYLLNLKQKDAYKMKINSNMTESYHTFSSNGKWLVFSSKRMDSRSTRPFFVHIDDKGETEKSFVLPQKDPEFYDRLLESYNIPELVKGKIEFTPRNFSKAANMDETKAIPGDTLWIKNRIKNKSADKRPNVEKGIHE